jgi:hypothetical protein
MANFTKDSEMQNTPRNSKINLRDKFHHCLEKNLSNHWTSFAEEKEENMSRRGK